MTQKFVCRGDGTGMLAYESASGHNGAHTHCTTRMNTDAFGQLGSPCVHRRGSER